MNDKAWPSCSLCRHAYQHHTIIQELLTIINDVIGTYVFGSASLQTDLKYARKWGANLWSLKTSSPSVI